MKKFKNNKTNSLRTKEGSVKQLNVNHTKKFERNEYFKQSYKRLENRFVMKTPVFTAMCTNGYHRQILASLKI